MSHNKIILDTDPGIDDAIAIIVLLKECGERVELILSSYGNISIENTTNNVITMLSLLDMDIPVIKGTQRPDNDKYTDSSYIHGVDGLGGLNVHVPSKKAINGDYLKMTYDAIIKAGNVDYITLGPLTNLSLLIKRYPDVTSHIENIVTMGGGIGRGNVTDYAEFNIYCDGESADYVFKNAKKLTLVPLNVTTTVVFSLEQIKQIGEGETPLAKAMEKILTENYNACVRYGGSGSIMNDATAVLYYLYPQLFKVKKCGLNVDCKEHYGETLIDNSRENIEITLETNPQILLSKIAECIK